MHRVHIGARNMYLIWETDGGIGAWTALSSRLGLCWKNESIGRMGRVV